MLRSLLLVLGRRSVLLLRTMATQPASPDSISPLVKVRNVEGEKLNVILDDCWGHHHKLLRDKNENVSKTLNRLVLSSLKSQKRKSGNRKRKRTDQDGEQEDVIPPIEAHLYTPSGEAVGSEVPNEAAWVDGTVLKLGSVEYKVLVNLPTVLSLTIPTCLATGCPAVPQVDLEFTDWCRWEWYRCSDHDQPPADLTDLERLSKSRVYWPSDLDSGHKLLLKCVPVSSDGKEGSPETILSVPVMESPKVTPITKRHLLTPFRLAESDMFRMVSYNTLAGAFTSDEYAHKVLYSYCDPSVLGIGYRQSRIVHELLGYNADVMCLQEVGTDTYKRYFLPALNSKGYDGCHVPKSGLIHEGEAIFYDASRFNLVAQESTVLRDFLEGDTSCTELHEGLKSAPKFLDEVKRKCTIVLVALLRSVYLPNHYLLVANTHLYYHPKGDGVRLVQTAVMLNYLRTRLDKFSEFLGGEAKIATVIGGDLNSCPCIAAYHYLLEGRVDRDHRDWMVYKMEGIPQCECYYRHNCGRRAQGGVMPGINDELLPHMQLKLERDKARADSADSLATAATTTSAVREGEEFRGLDLRHSFQFQNVTGTEECTNYTANFKAVLDYIMIDFTHLVTDRVVPLPSVEEVSEFVALPSAYFPSDHLALVADIKWKDQPLAN